MLSFTRDSTAQSRHIRQLWYESRRFKSKSHWASRQKTHPEIALEHFDDFYKSVFGNRWPSIRLGVLCADKKCVVVNNYGDSDKVMQYLKSEGALNVRKLFEDRKQNLGNVDERGDKKLSSDQLAELLVGMQTAEIKSLYPETADFDTGVSLPRSTNAQEEALEEETMPSQKVPEDPSINTPLTESLKEADYDKSRLIVPSESGAMLGASLYEFIPATKLKGMEDYMSESSHYSYFNTPSDFPIEVEEETNMNFPPLLNVYAFERGNCLEFPPAGISSTGVMDYKICKMGLLPPILALGLETGDKVLDMMGSADSALMLEQTIIPESIEVNVHGPSNHRDCHKLLHSYLYDLGEEESRLKLISSHALAIDNEGVYNKIFLCAPSTEDRVMLKEDEEDNIFNPALTKTRLKLPEEQAALLIKALKLVKEGGSVVYCTHTLSPIQNDAVVHMALHSMWHNTDYKFKIRDLTKALEPLQAFFEFAPGIKFGHLILPFLPNNCGPVYFCKIVKSDLKDPDASAGK